MSDPRITPLPDVAQRLGQTERWVSQQVRELGVPHVRLSRGRIAFTDDQYQQLLDALTVQSQQPTPRSRARRRNNQKGTAA